VKSINASHNALEALPETLSRLQRLREINVSHNTLIEAPPSLSKCTALIYINCQS
jgi:Leucine-rich repeat (LRR) protein